VCAVEVAAVEDGAGEVEVVAVPGHGRLLLEVGTDDVDDGEPDFAVVG